MSENMFGMRGKVESSNKPQEDFKKRLPMYERLGNKEMDRLILEWRNIDEYQAVDGVAYDAKPKEDKEKEIEALYKTLTSK